MRALRTPLALAGLLFLAARLPAQETHFYRAYVRNEDEYARAYNLAHTVVLSKAGEYVDLVATPRVASTLTADGIRVELVQARMVDRFNETRRKRGYGAYHSHDEMLQLLNRLERQNQDRMLVRSIGDSWETIAGRANHPIVAVKLARDVQRTDDSRPEVLYFAGIHAREVATTEVMIRFVQLLLDLDRKDPRVSFVMAHRQLWIIPVLNPDGREYVFRRDLWWRKNRRRLGGHGPVGVDLNRNFGFRWGELDDVRGSSSDPHSGTYRGEGPFSEPETRALRDFVLGRRFAASLSYHSYGEYLILPYGFSDESVPDAAVYQMLARDVTRSLGYRFGNVSTMVGYYSNGRHDDWLYSDHAGKLRTLAMEIELGRTFFPYEEELEDLSARILEPNLTLASLAGAYPEAELVGSVDPAGPGTTGPRPPGPGAHPDAVRDPAIAGTGTPAGSTLVLHNRGLRSARGVRVFLVEAGGRERSLTDRPIPELRGLLEGTGPGSVVLPVPSGAVLSGARTGPRTLRIEYDDGSRSVRHIPLDLPTD